MSKVLVTGGHGFLGTQIVDLLKYRGYNVIAPSIEEVDLRKKQAVCDMFYKHQPEYVINAAALVGGIAENMEAPGRFFYENVTMGLNVIEEAMRHETKKFVQVGTACAYPADAPMPLKETDIWNGYPEISNAPYGLAKRILLEQLRAYRAQYNFNGIYVVPTNLYGPGDRSHHVIPDTIKKIRRAKEGGYPSVNCWGTGQVTRDFLYVEDAAHGVVHMMEKYNDNEPMNLGSDSEWRLDHVIELIAQLMDYKGEIIFDNRQEMDGQKRRVLDTRAAKRYGWKALTGLRSGLAHTIDWFTGTKCAFQQ